MAFKKEQVEDLLVATGRRCCICFELHGVQVHHINPGKDGGSDEIDNAITLCPNCHDQVHCVWSEGRVTRHYTPGELRKHRERTINQVRTGMQIAVGTGTIADGATDILSRMSSGNVPLTQCVADSLALAKRHEDEALLEFCAKELVGQTVGSAWVNDSQYDYRVIRVFASLTRKINPSFWPSAATLFDAIQNDPEYREHFRTTTMFMNEPIAEIEDLARNWTSDLCCYMNLTLGTIMPDAKKPDSPLQGYIHPGEFQKVLGAIRAKLTAHLVRLA